MVKRFIIVLLLLFSNVAFAQSGLPDKQRQYMEKATKDGSENEGIIPDLLTDSLKNYGKEVLIDSVNNRQELIKIPEIKIDSTTLDQAKRQIKFIATDSLNNQKFIKKNELVQKIINVPVDSTTTNKVKQVAKSMALDSINNHSLIKDNEFISDVRELEQLKEIHKDSVGGHVKKELSERGEQYLKNSEEYKALSGMDGTDGFASMQEYQQKMEEIQQQLQETEARDALKQKLSTQGKKFASEHMQEIQQVQEHMGVIKQKYNEVTDSQDLSSAVKRTSLEGEPVWKRLVLGGNFNVSKTNPLNVDFSPIVGYKFNKLFEAGVSAAYRTQFKANQYQISQSNEEIFGFSVFASHMVFRSFFGYVESERMRKSGSILEIPTSNWHQTFLIGIGKRFSLTSWLEMQSIITVNLLHDNKDGIYNNPVVFKTGLRKK